MVWYGEAIDTSYTEAEEPRPAPPMTLRSPVLRGVIYIGHNSERNGAGSDMDLIKLQYFGTTLEEWPGYLLSWSLFI